MKKKYLRIIIIAVLVVLLLTLSYYFLLIRGIGNKGFSNKTIDYKKQDIMSPQEAASLGLYHLGVYEVSARDEAGKATAYQLVALNDEKTLTPEFMTDAEKEAMQIPLAYKIQVIERSASGTVSVYKLISSDADIVTHY
ncbi:MAG: hypothetical protein WC467_03535 [Patescibacteria group bacterium]